MLKRHGCETTGRSLTSLNTKRNRPVERKPSPASERTLGGLRKQTKVERTKRGFIRKSSIAHRKDQLNSDWESKSKRGTTLSDRWSAKIKTRSDTFLLERIKQREGGRRDLEIFIWSQRVRHWCAQGLSSWNNAPKRRANASSRGHIRHKPKVLRTQARGTGLWCQGEPAWKRKRTA